MTWFNMVRVVRPDAAKLESAHDLISSGSRSEMAYLLGQWYSAQGCSLGQWPSGSWIDFEIVRNRVRTLVSLDYCSSLRVSERALLELLHTAESLGADRVLVASGGGYSWAAERLARARRSSLEILDAQQLQLVLARALSLPRPAPFRMIGAAA